MTYAHQDDAPQTGDRQRALGYRDPPRQKQWPPEWQDISPEAAAARKQVREEAVKLAEAREAKAKAERSAVTLAALGERLAEAGAAKMPRWVTGLGMQSRADLPAIATTIQVEPWGVLAIAKALQLGVLDEGGFSQGGYERALAKWRAEGSLA